MRVLSQVGRADRRGHRTNSATLSDVSTGAVKTPRNLAALGCQCEFTAFNKIYQVQVDSELQVKVTNIWSLLAGMKPTGGVQPVPTLDRIVRYECSEGHSPHTG
jgi:hypothetical protein